MSAQIHSQKSTPKRSQKPGKSRFSRVLSASLAVMLAITGYPVPVLAADVCCAAKAVADALRKPSSGAVPAQIESAAQRAGKEQLVTRKAQLSSAPSDLELESARLFEEPLVALDAPSVDGENAALAKAIGAFQAQGNVEDISVLRKFLQAFPQSRWSASLQLNLALLRLHTGYICEALDDFKTSWEAAKSQTGQKQRLMAERAVSELLILYARLGRRDDLEAGLKAVASRPFAGSARERVDGAQEGLAAMNRTPKRAYRCGPLALNTILSLNESLKPGTPGAPVKPVDPRLEAFVSSARGTSLAEVKGWADKLDMHMQVAKRAPGAQLLVPSIMHWRAGHFTAITDESRGRFRVQDPTFERVGSLWISAQAVDSESDGYFLVSAGPLPAGWQSVSQIEAASVWGKGDSVSRDGSHSPGTPKTCMGAQCDSCPVGLAQAQAYPLTADLNIQDQPLGYNQPIGPAINFLANFNQRELGQPSLWFTSNLGPNWSLNWISWVSVDGSGNATVHTRGGGIESFPYVFPNNVTSPFQPALTSQAHLIIGQSGVYERLLPDGSIEVFGLTDGTGNFFLTSVLDPQGNAAIINYNSNFRVTSVVDANGNISTFSYVSNTLGNSGYFVISGISDPFGRSCGFTFDAANSQLLSITDAVGLVSKFSYDSDGSTITSLATPYGTTLFSSYEPAGDTNRPPRGLRFVFPDGTASVLESWIGHEKASYFWDREATALYPDDPANHVYSHARITRWAYMPTGAILSPAPTWTRNPLESQVNYLYAGSVPGSVTTSTQPVSVSQVLSGTQTQIADITGSVTPGDLITLSVFNVGLPIAQYSISHTAQSGDTLNSIASALASAINADTTLQSINLTATAAGSSIQLVTTSIYFTSYLATSSGGTEIIDINPANTQPNGSVTLSGTVTTGDVISVIVVNNTLPAKQVRKTYQVTSGDTLTTIAAALANAINSDATLSAAFINASAAGAVLTLQSNSSAATTYNASSNGGSETVTVGNALTQMLRDYNSFGRVSNSVDAAGRCFTYKYAADDIDLLEIRETQGNDNFLLGKWQYASQHVPTSYTDGSGRTWQYLYNAFGERTQSTDPLSGVTSFTYTATAAATIGGTVSSGDNPSITIVDPALSGGYKVISYTATGSDTTTTVAAALKSNINADTSLSALGVSATSSGGTITIKSTSVNKTTFAGTGSGAISVTLGTANYGFLTAIKGPMQQQDITSFAWDLKGTLASTTDSEGYQLAYEYDAMDRLTKTTFPDGTTEVVKYSNLDPVLFVDRLSRTTRQAFDALDQLVFDVDPLGRKTQYRWCACGSLSALTDGAGHTTAWSHDLQGRLSEKTYADGTVVAYLYEPATSRLSRRTDALGQRTDYLYNADNTLAKISYSNTVNPTSDVTYAWDAQFNRLRKAENGWGNYKYSYNPFITDPFATPTTGGGRLQQITNSVIPNSAITFAFDALGRTTNRSINGSSNSITWSYDAMSRVTQEVNALGTFGYTYLDNTSPNSKGVTRLASISYPNGQVTNFSWFDNNRDQRLKEIANLDPSSQVLSQFDYSYDSAGQITRWQQQQKTLHQNFALDYDATGQLTMATAGRGALPPPFANQSFYSYDQAANRTAVQTAQVQNLLIGGAKTTADVLTVTVNDSALSGGSQAINYTVASGDTLTTIAANLAATITANSSLQGIGVDAISSGTTITLRSKSPNVTTFTTSLSGGATETMVAGINNAAANITVGGTSHNGDVLQVIVRDPALSGGSTTVSYTVSGSPTLSAIASNLASAINGGTGLSALGVTASASNKVITVKSTSQNVTSYVSSVSGTGATVTLAQEQSMNGSVTALIGGTKTTGDVLTINVFDAGLSGGTKAVSYTVLSGDSLTSITTALATAVNNDTSLQGIGVTATSSGTKLTLTSVSTNATSYLPSKSTSVTETVLVGLPANGTVTASLGGTKTTGDTVTITVFDAGLTGGSVAKTYTVLAGDSLNSIATGVAAAINGDTNLANLGITAAAVTPTTSVSVVNITSTSNNATTYTQSTSGGATETIALSKNVGVSSASFNNVNELIGLAAGGNTRFQGTTDVPVKALTVLPGSSTLSITHQTPNSTAYAKSLSSGATETITLGTSGANKTATIGGTKTTGDILTLTFTTTALGMGGSHSTSYQVVAGDTSLTDVATHFTAALNADTMLQSAGIAATSSGAVITISNQTTFTSSVSGSATETVTFGTGSDGSVTATIGGTKTTGDVVSIIVKDGRLAGGQETASYTVVSSDNLTTIANGLVAAINANVKLPVIGVTAPNGLSLNSSLAFLNSPALSNGINTATVTGISGGGTGKTNTYQFGTLGSSSTTMTFDANGNMTSDGTNSFAWDAENRLVQITYPGTGNNSQFVHDPFGRKVKIEERTGGTLTSTKMFVWAANEPCEERDAAGTLTKEFLGNGQLNGSTKYLFSKDHLGSIREMSDNSGVVQVQYAFDPYGRVTKLQGTADSDFGFAGMYVHTRSGLNLTFARAYSANLGRFLNRDPIEEDGGINLFGYVDNNPANLVDRLGLDVGGQGAEWQYGGEDNWGGSYHYLWPPEPPVLPGPIHGPLPIPPKKPKRFPDCPRTGRPTDTHQRNKPRESFGPPTPMMGTPTIQNWQEGEPRTYWEWMIEQVKQYQREVDEMGRQEQEKVNRRRGS